MHFLNCVSRGSLGLKRWSATPRAHGQKVLRHAGLLHCLHAIRGLDDGLDGEDAAEGTRLQALGDEPAPSKGVWGLAWLRR